VGGGGWGGGGGKDSWDFFFVTSRISAGTRVCLSQEGLRCMELII
jgi:hypothetical protein